MTSRLTEDGHTAHPRDIVWEILHTYFNPEVSGYATPDGKEAYKVPEGVKIWFHESNCQKACDKFNRKNYPKRYYPVK